MSRSQIVLKNVRCNQCGNTEEYMYKPSSRWRTIEASFDYYLETSESFDFDSAECARQYGSKRYVDEYEKGSFRE